MNVLAKLTLGVRTLAVIVALVITAEARAANFPSGNQVYQLKSYFEQEKPCEMAIGLVDEGGKLPLSHNNSSQTFACVVTVGMTSKAGRRQPEIEKYQSGKQYDSWGCALVGYSGGRYQRTFSTYLMANVGDTFHIVQGKTCADQAGFDELLSQKDTALGRENIGEFLAFPRESARWKRRPILLYSSRDANTAWFNKAWRVAECRATSSRWITIGGAEVPTEADAKALISLASSGTDNQRLYKAFTELKAQRGEGYVGRFDAGSKKRIARGDLGATMEKNIFALKAGDISQVPIKVASNDGLVTRYNIVQVMSEGGDPESVDCLNSDFPSDPIPVQAASDEKSQQALEASAAPGYEILQSTPVRGLRTSVFEIPKGWERQKGGMLFVDKTQGSNGTDGLFTIRADHLIANRTTDDETLAIAIHDLESSKNSQVKNVRVVGSGIASQGQTLRYWIEYDATVHKQPRRVLYTATIYKQSADLWTKYEVTGMSSPGAFKKYEPMFKHVGESFRIDESEMSTTARAH